MKSLISLLKVLIKSSLGLIFKDFSQFGAKNILILGNGPSINQQWDLIRQKRDSAQLMVVNKFAITDRFFDLKPEHYVFLDGAFFNFTEEILQDPRIHPMVGIKENWEHSQGEINKTWLNILDADWPIVVWVPYIYRSSFILEKLEKANIRFQFYNYTVIDGWLKPALFKIKLGMPQSQNVINAAMAVSIWLKPKQVYVSGLDHTFHLNISVDSDNYLWDEGDHFYKGKEQVKKQKLIDLATSKKVTLAALFSSLAKVHLSYETLLSLSERNGVEIINVTEGGYVDAFKRSSLANLD